MFGKGYVIDYCIAFLIRQKKEQEYKYYITDTLKAIADNTAHLGGVSITKRYFDIDNEQPVSTKEQSADEIKNNIRATLIRLGAEE